ncbi:hypothetical protein RJ640_024708, partial [Escallonia rubra]
MKHFMQPRNTTLRENDIAPSSNPNSLKQKSSSSNRKQKCSKENAPPPDPNSMPHDSSPAGKLKSPLPPRPPPLNPLKRKLMVDSAPENCVAGSSDSGVKVVVRMRPPSKDEEEGEMIVQKISGDSLSILGQTFTFDSVANAESTQARSRKFEQYMRFLSNLDVFQLVGAPLVENCLAGFNSSVFAYGQTGSGKTYTIWGPANALLEENLWSDQQGLTPRVFEQLFSRISEEQNKHAEKQLIYQCRCSFLEIYNEQITDLLDPSQRNLQIREDVKTGVYVENLTEECVSTMKDVTQLLIKGLSNRRTGATSINAESSRSHSVFTCVVESRCKSVADGLSRLKSSRINLVDLAGSERQKLTGAAGERLKEAGNINRSLSQLGNLINILAEVSQTGKQRHIPYRDSKLTFLLQESLGGNAKLAMVCAISPAQSCKSETLSTLRFAQRAKAIKNKAVVNEEMQDDVNVLREVIRQLKDELLRMKKNGNQTDPNGGYSTGWNARRSLNLLKFSLNRPMTLPHVDEDGDEEMEIVGEADQVALHLGQGENNTLDQCKVEAIQLASQFLASKEGNSELRPKSPTILCMVQGSEDKDIHMEEEVSEQVDKHEVVNFRCRESGMDRAGCSKADILSHCNRIDDMLDKNSFAQGSEECLPSSVGLLNEELPGKPVGYSTVLSVESATHIPADDIVPGTHQFQNGSGDSIAPHVSIAPCDGSPVLTSPTPSASPRVISSRKSIRTSSMLTASLKDLKESNVPLEEVHSSFAKPSKSTCLNALPDQTTKSCYAPTELLAASLHRGLEIIDSHRNSAAFRRSSFRFPYKPADVKPILIQKVDVGVQTQLLEEDSKEYLCSRCQGRDLQQLNDAIDCSNLQLVPVDGSQSADKPKKQVPKLLKEKYENHPEVLRTKIELKRVQDELERYQNFFDMGERDILLEEIQDLKSQLQYYVDFSPARKLSPVLRLTYSCDPNNVPPLCTIPESTEENAEQKLELERIRWTEAESNWISLAEELRIELEASRSLAEKLKQDLDMEQKCSEELKEAMQMAMAGHARMLEQYAELQEKHIQMLARQRQIQDGIEDVKKAAAKAGVRGAESKFINALAAEISALRVERERERQYLKDENRGLQAQLRDTAEAVQAAGELLVRLKEAEEAVATAQAQAAEAGQETENASKVIDKLKKKHEKEVSTLNHRLVGESRGPREALRPVYDDTDMAKNDAHSIGDEQWREEFEPFYNVEEAEFSKLAEPPSS